MNTKLYMLVIDLVTLFKLIKTTNTIGNIGQDMRLTWM